MADLNELKGGAVAVASQSPSLLATMAARFGVEPKKMLATLKATAFKGEVTDEQMMALLIVANQYGLNPWTKEIYAFPDKNNGIVPVMGVDGWTRIMNSHDAFDGIEFNEDPEGKWCDCIIYRKDRARPTKVREWMSECKRNTGPWGSHPKRMLRHKALIQCARVAFSYGGIYDDDEAQAIIERDVTPITGTVTTQSATARLREVATINQEVNDATTGQSGAGGSGTGGVDSDGTGTEKGMAGLSKDASAELNGGKKQVVDSKPAEGGGNAQSGPPPPKAAKAVVDELRSKKTLDDLDTFISSFDGTNYSDQERSEIQRAYQGRREILVDKSDDLHPTNSMSGRVVGQATARKGVD